MEQAEEFFDRLASSVGPPAEGEVDGPAGIALGHKLSDATDDCLAEIFALALGIGPLEVPDRSDLPPVSLVATGGYGRREVCPFSDVDVAICYMPGTKGIKEISSAILYPLWDSGLRIGHSVRTPKEAVGVASSEIDVAVSHLDARMISGSHPAYKELSGRIASFVSKRSRRIVDDIFERRRRRLDALPVLDGLTCGAGYLQTDLKLGAGGLRDICTLEWSAKCLGVKVEELLPSNDLETLEGAKSDLLLLRSALHLCYRRQHDFLDASAVARLEARFGEALATQMIRKALAATVSVEAIAEQALARIATGNGGSGVLRALRGRGGSRPAAAIAFQTPTGGAAESERAAGVEVLETISGPLDDLFPKLKALQVRGRLQGAIPAWRDIEGVYQKDPYHTFSVDVHSMATPSRLLYALEKAVLDSPGVWPSRLFDDLTDIVNGRNPDRSTTLRLACLLHDVGKGRPGSSESPDVPEDLLEHAERGAETARRVATDLGLDPSRSEECAFLVRHHLLLAESASRRDVRDAATVEAVLSQVRDVSHLDDLYLLTLADASATGPQAWNSWRRSLITQLYLGCRRQLLGAGEATADTRSATLEGGRRFFADALAAAGIPEPAAASLAGAAPQALVEARPSSLNLAARSLQRHVGAAGAPAVEVEDLGDGFFELAISAEDAPGLFAKIAGVVALSGLSVVSAQAHTLDLETPVALDLFSVQAPPGRALSDEGRPVLEEKLRYAICGKLALNYRLSLRTGEWKKQLEARGERVGMAGGATVEPVVHVDNEFSRDCTVIEIRAANRPRLLYDVACTLAELGLDIKSAKISTMAETAADVFYVTDASGSKISDAEHMREARRALFHSLSSGL